MVQVAFGYFPHPIAMGSDHTQVSPMAVLATPVVCGKGAVAGTARVVHLPGTSRNQ